MTTLERLLAPIGLTEFVEQHWGVRALHIPGDESKFRELYSRERFEQLFSRDWPAPATAKAVFGPLTPTGSSSRIIPPAEIPAAYAAGATICISRLDAVDPGMAALCGETKAALGYCGEVGVNAYWSPDGAGFSPHFDTRVVTTLQLEGTKTWRYSAGPAVPWPADNAIIVDGRVHYMGSATPDEWELRCDPDALDPLQWRETTLSPGDVLCLPAGAIHSASAHGHSFALNLHFNGLDTARHLGELWSRWLADGAGWRHIPPLLAGDGRHGGPNERALAFMQERFDELIQQLQKWRDDPTQWIRHAAALVAVQARQAAGNAATAGSADEPEHDRVRCAPALVIASSRGDPEIVAMLGTERFTAEDRAAAILRAALTAGDFRISELRVPDVDASEIEEVLRALLAIGALEPRTVK